MAEVKWPARYNSHSLWDTVYYIDWISLISNTLKPESWEWAQLWIWEWFRFQFRYCYQYSKIQKQCEMPLIPRHFRKGVLPLRFPCFGCFFSFFLVLHHIVSIQGFRKLWRTTQIQHRVLIWGLPSPSPPFPSMWLAKPFSPPSLLPGPVQPSTKHLLSNESTYPHDWVAFDVEGHSIMSVKKPLT